MGIDRIGKGAPPPTPDAQGTGAVDKKAPGAVEKPFSATLDEAHRAQRTDAAHPASHAAGAEAVRGTSPLERLRAGEIDVNGYVDLKVEEATRGLEGLSPAELDDIKKMLRDQMVTDPGLSDLVRAAAGSVPSPPDE